tara:strand:+ start:18882 stop:19256 length:375 start_codon:yes stop_codon:yes gene_type:complete
MNNKILESNDLIKSMEDNLIKLLYEINDQITQLKNENTILHNDNKKLYDKNIILNNRLKLYQLNKFPVNRPCGSYLLNMILNDDNSNIRPNSFVPPPSLPIKTPRLPHDNYNLYNNATSKHGEI